jgi:hypothetical protein
MFRFTIRELLLLSLVVAVTLAWWLDRSRLAETVSGHRGRESVLCLLLDHEGWRVKQFENGFYYAEHTEGMLVAVGGP